MTDFVKQIGVNSPFDSKSGGILKLSLLLRCLLAVFVKIFHIISKLEVKLLATYFTSTDIYQVTQVSPSESLGQPALVLIYVLTIWCCGAPVEHYNDFFVNLKTSDIYR